MILAPPTIDSILKAAHQKLPSPDQVTIGYCTNVHAGTNLESIRSNLHRYAGQVLSSLTRTRGQKTLGVGLWIPDEASTQLIEGELVAFAEFLRSNHFDAFTINGFPFANFHGDSVKQRVYLPTWCDQKRLRYTENLATILAALLPEDQPVGSISTLPIGWPGNPYRKEPVSKLDLDLAGQHLRDLSRYLAELEKKTGRRIVVAIEPEPGCVIDSVNDLVEFFEQQLPNPIHRKFITVCHDICHSAVMNEPQNEVIEAYADHGIGIGKVQVSSAIVADWKTIQPNEYDEALAQLRRFAEDRYLHQTGQVSLDGEFSLASDLPELLETTNAETLESLDRWVIHFHVPVFLERFGLLQTSRAAVLECLTALSTYCAKLDFTGHLEIETYAWTVLPDDMRQNGLAEDIASEIDWLLSQLTE